MPIVATPFERIGVDLIGHITLSTGGHQFILVVVDYATQYPEAMALRTASASAVAQGLATLFTRVGSPKQVVTDQGIVFMGKMFKALAQLVGILTYSHLPPPDQQLGRTV